MARSARWRPWLFCVSVLLTGTISATAIDRPGIPPVIGESNGKPAWVAATHAIGERGELREDVFTEHDLTALRSIATKNRRIDPSTPNDPCRVYLGTTPEHFKPTSSLAALTTHAAAVVSGTIEGRAEGFYFGMPGTLFRVSATYLKGSPARETYLFYPRARIHTAGGVICARPPGDFADPEPGERVLVFRMEPPTTFGDRIIIAVNIARELIHERRGGDTRIPALIQSSHGRDLRFDDLHRAVAARLEKEPQPAPDVP